MTSQTIHINGKDYTLDEKQLSRIEKSSQQAVLFDTLVESIQNVSGLKVTLSKSSGRPMITYNLVAVEGSDEEQHRIFGRLYIMSGKKGVTGIERQTEMLCEQYPLVEDKTAGV